MEYLHILQSVPLFAGIREGELPSLLQCLNAREKPYKKDEMIFFAGEPAEAVGVVLNGKAHVLKEDFMGNRTILAPLAPGDLFGEAFACAKTERLPVSVLALAQCSILLLDYKKIITTCPAACAFHSRLIENMLGILAEKNVLLNQKIDIVSRRTTREKLIAFLSAWATKMGRQSFTIPFNRQELADYLCVERSAMSAELSKMQHEGLLHTQKSAFDLLMLPEE